MSSLEAPQRRRTGAQDLWTEIAQAARATAGQEPALRPLLAETVLARAEPETQLAAVLARRLAGAHENAVAFEALIADTLMADRSIRAATEADLAAVLALDPACASALDALLTLRGFQALQVHRAAHSLWRRGRRAAAGWLASRACAAFGPDIHPAAQLGRGIVIDHGSGVVIGETALVEDGVLILHGVTLGATGKVRGDRHPKVRRGAVIGAGAQVLGNIEVGTMSRVGAGSVVLAPVPAHCTVAGVPARVVRERVRVAA